MIYKNRHGNRLQGARLKNHDLSTETYNLPHDLWGYKHVGMFSAYHYLLRISLNMTAIYGGQEENLRFLKSIRLTNCRLSKYSVRKDTAFGPCKNFRRTIPSGLFEQRVQKSVNKQTKKRVPTKVQANHWMGLKVSRHRKNFEGKLNEVTQKKERERWEARGILRTPDYRLAKAIL